MENGHHPLALIVPAKNKASHAKELIEIVGLDKEFILEGNDFKTERGLAILNNLNLDYIFGIHFPYIIPSNVLSIPKVGFLNLHPAFLPFNKGWHTPSWAILENTPYGASLHFMAAELDAGDIILQKQIEISETDTADSLYQRVLRLEEEIFKESLPALISLNPARIKQTTEGTLHIKSQLKEQQRIDLNKMYTGKELIDKLRACTTNQIEEAVFFEKEGNKYFVQIRITEEQ
jgi:methionyl-tRNA formyltransferase